MLMLQPDFSFFPVAAAATVPCILNSGSGSGKRPEFELPLSFSVPSLHAPPSQIFCEPLVSLLLVAFPPQRHCEEHGAEGRIQAWLYDGGDGHLHASHRSSDCSSSLVIHTPRTSTLPHKCRTKCRVRRETCPWRSALTERKGRARQCDASIRHRAFYGHHRS